MLEQFGRELRRPRSDFLRNGVYELRTEVSGVHYRLLYGFVGKDVVLVSHGLTKRAIVPDRDIELAIVRLEKFRRALAKHTAAREERDD